MTAITLPLNEIPGHSSRLTTFFGGRKITGPMVLLLTIPVNLYLYFRLSKGVLLVTNLIGLLPYFWGLVSIIYYIKESSRMMDFIVQADLNDAERIFNKSKVEFRKILVSNCFSSIIMVVVFSYLLLAHGMLTLFVVGVSSITSVGVSVAAIICRYELRWILSYLFTAFAFEAASLFIALIGQWEFVVIFPVASFMFVYSSINRVRGYNLRSFFERVIN